MLKISVMGTSSILFHETVLFGLTVFCGCIGPLVVTVRCCKWFLNVIWQ